MKKKYKLGPIRNMSQNRSRSPILRLNEAERNVINLIPAGFTPRFVPESPPTSKFSLGQMKRRMSLEENHLRAELAVQNLKRKRLSIANDDLYQQLEDLSTDNLVLKYEVIKLQNAVRKVRMHVNSMDGEGYMGINARLTSIMKILRDVETMDVLQSEGVE